MSFETIEESRALGAPTTLLLFRYGENDGAFYAYTAGDTPVTHVDPVLGSITYRPIPVEMSEFTSSGTLDKQKFDVTVPRTAEIAALMRTYPPGYSVNLTVRQGHLSDQDNDWPVVWLGRVLACTREGNRVKLNCEPMQTSLRRVALRRRYMRPCPLVLYGVKCKASMSAASSSHIPDTIGATAIVMPAGWASAEMALKYAGGVASWAGGGGQERRTILAVGDDLRTLRLSGPTAGLTGGEAVSVAFGCSHTLALVDGALSGDCVDLHDNVLNYGGQPWIPEENPVGKRNSSY